MSLNDLKHDACTYKYDLKQSIGPGEYALAEPNIECKTCFDNDPYRRMSNRIRRSSGVSLCKTRPLIDVDSELKNITRYATNCPAGKYRGDPYCTDLKHFPDCTENDISEPTRYSNPPCTLRSTGWNRWEWLCRNPQDRALVPFDFNINGRLIAKDNHRPCVETPFDQTSALPPTPEEEATPAFTCKGENIADTYSTRWRECSTYGRYM